MLAHSDQILLVDENGRPCGEEDKDKCHDGEGILHGAFLVLILNPKGELMLAQRSARKRLWPDYWDGTLASHYRPNVDPETTVRNRIFEEIGVRNVAPRCLFDFRYRAAYRDIGSENELCDVFILGGVKEGSIAPAPGEISAYRFLGLPDAAREAETAPEGLTPWFLIAFRMFAERYPGRV